MKKFSIILVLVAVLAFTLVFPASASGFQDSAEQLNRLGLFQGVDGDYQLDREPTRAEAITMLVRFLGLEEDALNGEYAHPFTDADWASPYIAIAYELGYTTGATETTFDPQGLCTAQMYLTYIARALGYSDDDVDTTLWSEAQAFGKKIGIVDDIILADTFMRGQMTVVSHLALSASPVGGEFDTLLEKLVADGAVDATLAASQLLRMSLLDEISNIGSELDSETRLAMICNLESEVLMMGMAIPIDAHMEMQIVVEEADIGLTMVMEMSTLGDSGEIETHMTETYITDGYIYTVAEDEKYKMSIESILGMSLTDLLLMAETVEAVDFVVYPSYFFKDITKGTDAGYTVYSIEISTAAVNGIINQVMAMLSEINLGDLGLGEMDLGGMNAGLVFDNLSLKYFNNAGGELVMMEISFDIAMSVLGVEVLMSMYIDYEITAKGADVVLVFPDNFDDYVEIDVADVMV